jgi:hypothetical protein
MLALVRAQPLWGLLALAFVFAWAVPARWVWQAAWGDFSSPLTWQLLVPVCTLLLVWARRHDLNTFFGIQARRERDGARKHRKPAAVFLCGWLLYIFALFFQGPIPAFGGLVLMMWGIVFYLYGAGLFRLLLLPFLFSFLLLPPPQNFVARFAMLFESQTARIARGALNLFQVGISVQPSTSPVAHTTLMTPAGLISMTASASGGAVCGLCSFLLLFYGLYRRYPIGRVAFITLLAGVFAYIVNLVRLLIGVFVFSSAQATSNAIMSLSPWWIAVGVVPLLVLLERWLLRTGSRLEKMLRLLGKPIERALALWEKPADIVWKGGEVAAGVVSKVSERSQKPFDMVGAWIGKSLMRTGKALLRPSQWLETAWSRGDRARRRKRQQRNRER